MKAKRIIKSGLALLLSMQLALMSCITALAAPEWPSDTGVLADIGIAVDADSGAVLFGQGIHELTPPASITKLLTALVVVENSSMDDMVTFSYDAVNNVESGSGNKKNIAEGDKLSVKDCLYLLLLQSSNQAANALAEHVAGSRDAFADMMNEKVKELGCTDGTHFANPSGLNDDTQVVSAYDMAIIAQAAFNNSDVLEISSTKSYKLAPTQNNLRQRAPPDYHRRRDKRALLPGSEGRKNRIHLPGRQYPRHLRRERRQTGNFRRFKRTALSQLFPGWKNAAAVWF